MEHEGLKALTPTGRQHGDTVSGEGSVLGSDAPSGPAHLSDLKPGRHLCCLYRNDEEHRALVAPYVRAGLENEEKVVYIVDAHAPETVLDYLRDDGLSVRPYLDSGQLAVLRAGDSYLRSGLFDPDAMIEFLSNETDRATDDGFSALRVTGEMTWALRGAPGSNRLMEYEAKLNHFFPGRRCLAICQYDCRRFDPIVILDVLATHPAAVIGSEVHENFYYLPPEDFLGPNRSAAMLNRWISNLRAHKNNQRRIAESHSELERFANELLNKTRMLEQEIARRAHTEHELEQKNAAVVLQLKKLDCLQAISDLAANPANSLERIIKGIVDLIPASTPRPDIVGARIVWDGKSFASPFFHEDAVQLRRPIIVNEAVVGSLELTIPADGSLSASDSAALVRQESQLMEIVAERVARIAERHQLIEELELGQDRRVENLRRLECVSPRSPTPISIRLYGLSPLRESAPARFEGLTARFAALIDRAVEARIYKVVGPSADDVRPLADDLGFLNAGPRDVAQILSTALSRRAHTTTRAKSRAYMEEGRMIAFELMGLLVSFYQNRAGGLGLLRRFDGQDLDRSKETTNE
jgi:hypothetical protein